MDRDRLAEQTEVLDEIVSVCEEKGVELVLVAGDIFDTYLPPAEAEEVFFRTVKKLAADSRAVVLISGNHDDGVRLSASAPIAGAEGIYIFGARGQKFPLGGSRPVKAVAAGENYVIIENSAGERVYINALPYPNEARLREGKSEETYAEKTLRWISAGDAFYDGTCAHVLLSHLFVAGGSVSESERDVSLGGARAVPSANLPTVGYNALGHLHKKQKIGNACYSGSVLQYSFDEANTEKYVLLLETNGKEIELKEEIPIKSGIRLARLEANSVEDAIRLLHSQEGKYVELTLHLAAPLTAFETQSLREANEKLVSLITHVNSGEASPIVSRAELGAGELFTEFCRAQSGEEPPDALKELFLLLLGEEDA